MRRMVLSMTMLMSGWANAGAIRAGVYNLDPPGAYPSDYVMTNFPQPMNLLMDRLNELRVIRDNPLSPGKPAEPSSLRASYLRQFERLEAKRKEGVLNARERVNLGACLIRLGRYPKAQELLEESIRLVPRDNGYHFLLQLNLAAVCQEDNSLLQRALELQREALKAWPAILPNWNRQESDWFHHVESYALTLMELRNREQIRRGGRPIREQLSPDLLFPREERDLSKKVQFIGDSGAYEAGGIAWKQWERLPADAERLVLQLLFWRPHDPRLLWLHGELLNARGQVDWAYYAMYNVRENYQWRNRELDRHFRILDAAVKSYRVLFTDKTQSGENLRKQALLLWRLTPRGAALAPGIAAAANEIGGLTASTFAGALSAGRLPPELAASQGTDAPRSGAVLPDWRHLAVSFITGIVVAVLGVLQWQQWRRHRHDEAATDVRAASVSERPR